MIRLRAGRELERFHFEAGERVRRVSVRSGFWANRRGNMHTARKGIGGWGPVPAGPPPAGL
jgi:hypothetical protein